MYFMKAYVSADNAVNPSDPWGAYDDNTVIETEDGKFQRPMRCCRVVLIL